MNMQEQFIPYNPFDFFFTWFTEAVAARLPLPQAMTLATSTRQGIPSARIVLLKEVTYEGLVFFTNFQSRKGKELQSNPRAALVFHWPALHRQVRVEGSVIKVADELSDTYFSSRPRGSQLGAWASPQSKVIAGKDTLTREFETLETKYKNHTIPRPPFWGGYQLVPTMFEFWLEQENRLHERLRFKLKKSKWCREILAP